MLSFLHPDKYKNSCSDKIIVIVMTFCINRNPYKNKLEEKLWYLST